MRPLFSFALKASLFTLFLSALLPAPAVAQTPWPRTGYHWVGSWGASPSAPFASITAPNASGNTLRVTAHMSIPATNGLRIRLSNALTDAPVTFIAVHIGLWAGSASKIIPDIVAGSDQTVTFNNGSAFVTIAANGEVVSDSLNFKAAAGQDIAVSIFVATNSPAVTMHSLANATSYYAPGDQTGSTTLTSWGAYGSRSYLSGVEVLAPLTAAAVVTLGDSITDGAYSTMDGDTRWPDDLGVRLNAAYGDKVGIVNAGISQNRVLLDGTTQSALARFNRDVLSVSGVKFVVVLEGINDLGNDSGVTVPMIIAGLQSVIARAHDAGLYIYGGTLTPMLGSSYYTPANEAMRQEINSFIRSTAPFDGVIDFDLAIADPANPAQILPKYQGDCLHPNAAGYQAMANAVNLTFFNTYTH